MYASRRNSPPGLRAWPPIKRKFGSDAVTCVASLPAERSFVFSAEPHTVPKASNRREQRYSLEGVDRLTQEYRRVLLLDHFEDYPQQDIARFLGLTQSTVKWRLLRARQSLKVKLEEVFYSRAAQVHVHPCYPSLFRCISRGSLWRLSEKKSHGKFICPVPLLNVLPIFKSLDLPDKPTAIAPC